MSDPFELWHHADDYVEHTWMQDTLNVKWYRPTIERCAIRIDKPLFLNTHQNNVKPFYFEFAIRGKYHCFFFKLSFQRVFNQFSSST